MNKGKKWETLSQFKAQNSKFKTEELLKILLQNRGLKTQKEIDAFLKPSLESVSPKAVGLDSKQFKKAIARIQQAIENKEQIVVFGDYDVDGITATAILWETLYSLGASVVPYIPHRVDEGYGLSIKGVKNVILNLFQDLKEIPVQARNDNRGLIITVDNGIVANEAVDFAAKEGIDVIITDHHTLPEKLPDAFAIVHTTQLCGAGVAWMLSQEILKNCHSERSEESHSINKMGSFANAQDDSSKPRIPNDHLALVALATVADLVPLTGANRVLLTYGLEVLRQTKRPGMRALCEEAEMKQEEIDVYAIGHILAPRLNAMGRLESAMDSLRLLCTKDSMRAKALAEKLGTTNKERQLITQSLSQHAKSSVINSKSSIKKILFIANDAYEEGVIGLIAGKLVEEFYRPAIVLSIGEKQSKASARSVVGFNIIEFIRSAQHLLINAGGHPMAAGFTLETEKITLLQEYLENLAEEQLDEEMLIRVLKIDCELSLDIISPQLYKTLQTLGPFGMANPEPVFSSKVLLKEIKTVGQEGKHLKLKITNSNTQITNKLQSKNQNILNKKLGFGAWDLEFNAIAFGMGDMSREVKLGDTIDIAYTISENVWNGNTELQLKIKDLKPQK